MKIRTIIEELSEDIAKKDYEVRANEHLTLILLAAGSTEYKIGVVLSGENAGADIYGIILGTGSSQISLHTLQDHRAPNTRSNLLIKSALSGRSQFNYEGYIVVAKGAQQTNAYQRNENLMLSPEAKAESKPALEILANDVRCTHSATIGKVDQEQLFYLESRGINKMLATSLIVGGFFQIILDKIEDKKMETNIKDKIDKLFFERA